MADNAGSVGGDRIEDLFPGPARPSRPARHRRMVMNFWTVSIGSFMVFASVVAMVVALPMLSYNPPPSQRARPLTPLEARGRELYAANGCWYCHSQTNRPQDVSPTGLTTVRGNIPSQAGDYAYVFNALLGSERTGPDLAMEGGVHTDDWQLAHFKNPRNTEPESLMPRFSWLSTTDLQALIAYVQSLGGKDADARVAAQRDRTAALLGQKPLTNPQAIAYVQDQTQWSKTTVNPLPVNESVLVEGKKIFFTHCIGCHGVKGDGGGPASQFLTIKPFNFTSTIGAAANSPGLRYFAILNGRLGTAMPAWGNRLTVEEIWAVEWFLRTIPNCGAEQVPTTAMVVPPGYKGPPGACDTTQQPQKTGG